MEHIKKAEIADLMLPRALGDIILFRDKETYCLHYTNPRGLEAILEAARDQPNVIIERDHLFWFSSHITDANDLDKKMGQTLDTFDRLNVKLRTEV